MGKVNTPLQALKDDSTKVHNLIGNTFDRRKIHANVDDLLNRLTANEKRPTGYALVITHRDRQTNADFAESYAVSDVIETAGALEHLALNLRLTMFHVSVERADD